MSSSASFSIESPRSENPTHPTTQKTMKLHPLFVVIPPLIASAGLSSAATMFEDQEIGTDLLFNGGAAIGGGDHNTTNSLFTRTWDPLNVGVNGSTISITGLAFALSGAGNTNGSSLTVTVTYLGADGAAAGGDDVLIGTTTATLEYTTGAGVYGLVFDAPLVANIDGENTVFSVRLQNSSSMRLKTTTGTGAAAVKMNVAGTSTALAELADSDMDGVPDIYETNTGTWVSQFDTGTDPNNDDSDNDDLLDGWEINSGVFVSATNTGTDPNKLDSDSDTFSDGIESNSRIYNGQMDPGTDPNKIDTDDDTFNDNIENNSGIYNGPTDPGTDPNLTDSDFDGINDNLENNSGINNGPTDPGTNPNYADSEDNGFGDGMDDGWEALNGTNPHINDSLEDPDSDDLDNLAEFNANSNPQDPDSDNDTLTDGVEANPLVIGYTGTSPTNRDTDGDRLSDAVETNTGTFIDRFNTGSDPNLANSDTDEFSDGLEVLFYGSDPNIDTSFPGDGIAPAPGELTEILNGGSPFDNPANLGSTIIAEAALGGGDYNFGNGNTNFVAFYQNAFPAPGTNVSLSGFAWVVTGAGNANGDILLEFYDPGSGGFKGIDQATFLGSATGTLTTTGATTIMYWNFETPITFTSESTSLAVRIQSTASLRIKAQDNISSGQWQFINGSGFAGNIRTSSFSIGGTIITTDGPKILTFTRSGTTTSLTWDLGAAASVNLERSTDLGASDPWSPVLENTSATSYQETSSDPKAFFRIVSP
jgi:hypothetical protein